MCTVSVRFPSQSARLVFRDFFYFMAKECVKKMKKLELFGGFCGHGEEALWGAGRGAGKAVAG